MCQHVGFICDSNLVSINCRNQPRYDEDARRRARWYTPTRESKSITPLNPHTQSSSPHILPSYLRRRSISLTIQSHLYYQDKSTSILVCISRPQMRLRPQPVSPRTIRCPCLLLSPWGLRWSWGMKSWEMGRQARILYVKCQHLPYYHT